MRNKLRTISMAAISCSFVLSPTVAFAGTQQPNLCTSPVQAALSGKSNLGSTPDLFQRLGYSPAAINQKISVAWEELFHGDPTSESVYYNLTPDKAYIEDIGDGDVRTEGMGYGMMIAVQLNHQKEFNALWNYAKTFMQHQSGSTKYYFSWHTKPDGTVIDTGVAPDGDQWITAALVLASERWGNGKGIYNYGQQAQQILHAMWHNADHGGVNMFDKTTYLPTFSPPNTVGFTDPSYSLPAFYPLFAAADPRDANLWVHTYFASEKLLQNAANKTTGLAPDYSQFDGSAYGPSWGTQHQYFEFDAWRAIANANVDAAWYGVKPWQTQYSNTLENFFYSQGINTYGNNYALDGTELKSSSGHSTGLVAMNASSAISATSPYRDDFVRALWNQSVPSGEWRYYDGMLYMLGLLYDSGNFKMFWWNPNHSN